MLPSKVAQNFFYCTDKVFQLFFSRTDNALMDSILTSLTAPFLRFLAFSNLTLFLTRGFRCSLFLFGVRPCETKRRIVNFSPLTRLTPARYTSRHPATASCPHPYGSAKKIWAPFSISVYEMQKVLLRVHKPKLTY
jgi:hypothetical protein